MLLSHEFLTMFSIAYWLTVAGFVIEITYLRKDLRAARSSHPRPVLHLTYDPETGEMSWLTKGPSSSTASSTGATPPVETSAARIIKARQKLMDTLIDIKKPTLSWVVGKIELKPQTTATSAFTWGIGNVFYNSTLVSRLGDVDMQNQFEDAAAKALAGLESDSSGTSGTGAIPKQADVDAAVRECRAANSKLFSIIESTSTNKPYS